jgi:ArsR family transcriptional regulator, arsenate/arsenite/antimonite-responsive transcriptional repressor
MPLFVYRRRTMNTSSDSCAPDLCPPPRPAADATLPPGVDPDQELARLARAIGHPVRVQILRLLAERESCVCGDLVEVLPVGQSTVSEHLRLLKEAGLIRGEIQPPRVCYCLEPAGMARLKTLMGSL